MPWKTLLAAVSGELDGESARQIDFLKAENRILKKQITGRPKLGDVERRQLAELGKPLGRKILAEISTIVTPDTISRWHRQLIAKKLDGSASRRRTGRPPTPEEIRELVLRCARENPSWGYTRIRDALKNIGHELSRSTVANVFGGSALEPSPRRRTATSWHDFIRAHKDVLFATDFFTQEVWKPCGLVTDHVLFVIHIGSRRVHLAGVSDAPHAAFMEQAARELTFEGDGFVDGGRFLIHDRDSKYTDSFLSLLEGAGIESIRLPLESPNLNSLAERWRLPVRSECLDRLILFGERSLRYALREYLRHYHGERSHQGLDSRLIDQPKGAPPQSDGINCRERLGGLLELYHRQAA